MTPTNCDFMGVVMSDIFANQSEGPRLLRARPITPGSIVSIERKNAWERLHFYPARPYRIAESESTRPLRSTRIRGPRNLKIAMYNIIGVGFWLVVVLLFWSIIYLASRLSVHKPV
jgi:hypothetical protein